MNPRVSPLVRAVTLSSVRKFRRPIRVVLLTTFLIVPLLFVLRQIAVSGVFRTNPRIRFRVLRFSRFKRLWSWKPKRVLLLVIQKLLLSFLVSRRGRRKSRQVISKRKFLMVRE